MSMSIGAFGGIVFETSDRRIITFQDFKRRQRARYATHDVLNHQQKLQFQMVELQTVTFKIHLHHRFCDPKAEMQKLQGILEEHEAHQLTIGGQAMGQFVLEEITENWDIVAKNGVVMSAKTELSLKEYR